MEFLDASNSKQLDICLRMLYAENIKWLVKIVEDNKGKIRYKVGINVEPVMYDAIKEKYRIMIS